MGLRLLLNRAFHRKSWHPLGQRSVNSVPRLHARRLCVVLAALASPLAGGCVHGDDCQIPEARCDGDVALNCTSVEGSNGHYRTWGEVSCSANSCKVDEQGAFCALAPAPDPACSDASAPACDGSVLIECRAGYALSKYDCSSATPPGQPYEGPWIGNPAGPFCVATIQGHPADPSIEIPVGFCAAEAESVAPCKGMSMRSFDPEWACSGNDSVECWDGYVLNRTRCESTSCEIGSGKCL